MFLPSVVAATEPDSISTDLHEIVVEATGGRTVKVKDNGDLKVNTASLQRGMRVMGEADILGAIKRSGGVSAISDYGSGAVILGSDPSQSVYRINNAPVFFPYRFGGIFSTFNSAHFRTVEVTRAGRDASAPNRLGALIDFTPDLQYQRSAAGGVNLGLLSSSLTFKSGIHDRFAITVSGRISYVDQLYGRFLNTDDNTISYRFYDVNASAGWKIDSLNTITADFFTNTDRIGAGNGNYAMNTDLDWHNRVASIRWRNSGKHETSVTAFYSDFGSDLTVAFPQYDVMAPAKLQSCGLKTDVVALPGHGYVPTVTSGAELNCYNISPLHAGLSGELAREGSAEHRQRPVEGRIYADACFSPRGSLSFSVGLSGGVFRQFLSVDPRAGIEYRHRGNVWSLGIGRFTQFLHCVGFSEIGLASNFWYAANSEIKPQHSVDIIAGWMRNFLNNEIRLSATAYYKYVTSQSEYYGQILDVIDSDYDASRHIRTADGYNAGVEVDVQKNFGSLTGSVSYSFGRAIRRRGDVTFRALTDAGHQVKADAEYMFNAHWSLSAAFVYASGRVYTPVRYLYLISGRLMSEYGKRNSARLPDYQRLDLSATYRFKSGGKVPLTHMINLSMINLYGHKNVESQYFTIDIDAMDYRLRRDYSLYRFLPSISYSIDF